MPDYYQWRHPFPGLLTKLALRVTRAHVVAAQEAARRAAVVRPVKATVPNAEAINAERRKRAPQNVIEHNYLNDIASTSPAFAANKLRTESTSAIADRGLATGSKLRAHSLLRDIGAHDITHSVISMAGWSLPSLLGVNDTMAFPVGMMLSSTLPNAVSRLAKAPYLRAARTMQNRAIESRTKDIESRLPTTP